MAFSAGASALQNRRQALINLALKRDPIPLRQKQAVSFVDGSSIYGGSSLIDEIPSHNGPVNELPKFDTFIGATTVPSMTVDDLPLASPIIKPSSARSISSITSL